MLDNQTAHQRQYQLYFEHWSLLGLSCKYETKWEHTLYLYLQYKSNSIHLYIHAFSIAELESGHWKNITYCLLVT